MLLYLISQVICTVLMSRLISNSPGSSSTVVGRIYFTDRCSSQHNPQNTFHGRGHEDLSE